MNIEIIESALLKSLEHCKSIRLTNSLFTGIVPLGDNDPLQKAYCQLAATIVDAVNFLDKDVEELNKARELENFHKANRLKGNARAISDNEMKIEFGMTATQIAEILHHTELAPYETIANN